MNIGDKVHWTNGDGIRIKVKIVGFMHDGAVAVIRMPWTWGFGTYRVRTSELETRDA